MHANVIRDMSMYEFEHSYNEKNERNFEHFSQFG